jgi:5-oxoprolinase (ATP-hydrolysing)
MSDPWRIFVDVGGTFTDCLALDPGGGLHRTKVLSNAALRGRVRRVEERRVAVEQGWGVPDDFVRGFRFAPLGAAGGAGHALVLGYDARRGWIELDRAAPLRPGDPFELRSPDEAPVLASRMVMGVGHGPLPPLEVRLATTRGTNALLERRGAAAALFLTRGFGDLLLIGDQRRPDLFSLCIRKPRPLQESVIEVDERLAPDGSVLRPLDLETAVAAGRTLLERGVRAAAVAFLHSYRNPQHERALAARLRGAGFEHVCCSSDLSPSIRILPRAQTALVGAYLGPVLAEYLDGIAGALAGGARSEAPRFHVLTSAGGLVGASACRPGDCLLSGPAGGVAGAAGAGRRSGFPRVIGFDMGGTSTDVARYDGDFEYQFEHRVGDVLLAAPALAIETVAAGGGSVCRVTEHGLAVGPQSAGADPGPACYGAGGPLTLTDVNLLLGRLDPGSFEIPIFPSQAEAAVAALLPAAGADRDRVLDGFLQIANEHMADAIAEISLRKGYDPRDYALVAFGGAGGQHACAVAQRLGIETVIMPADASLLSAAGLAEAVVERFARRQVLRRLEEIGDELAGLIDELCAEACDQVALEGVPRRLVAVRRRIVNLRVAGQDSTIPVEETGSLTEAFARRYRATYGHAPPAAGLEVESIAVVAAAPGVPLHLAPATALPGSPGKPRTGRARFEGGWQDVEVWQRQALDPGAAIEGPALLFEPRSALVIEPGWRAEVDAAGAIVLRSRGPRPAVRADAVRAELFAHRLAAVARQMGRVLERTALSTNVRERMDFSCAVLDGGGALLVNAPHIPVHLGALGPCVRALRSALPMGPGDVVVTNHPGFGGSHLPDVTVVTPVFLEGDRPLAYLASRAHHAEIGGTRPGSMPPLARVLAEEGVLIPPTYLVRGGEPEYDRIQGLLCGAPHPSRAVRENLADLRAAVAANRFGARALADLAGELGADAVAAEMAALTLRAERQAREALARLPAGRYEALRTLDDGSPIRVRVDLGESGAVVDFTGSSPVHPGNLNAAPAVVTSAVLYVIRVLAGEGLPLNEGLLRAVELRVPPGMLAPDFGDDPRRAPAVGGGNVETSQRIVEALLCALRMAADSQGTMNNVLFGNDRFSYYETVCGGAGATPNCDGAAAVHTHMTNTRITDPEILEQRYPVRLERFAVRRGSGGRGRRRGGDGAVRELTFLEPMSLSILSQHRAVGPQGMDGGGPGLPGAQRVLRAGGDVVPLGAVAACDVGPGDRLVLETPGGGGWGTEGVADRP